MKMVGGSTERHYSAFFLLLTIFLSLSGCGTGISPSPSLATAGSGAHPAGQSASQYVVIDQSEPAFTVFTGIPQNLEKAKLDKLKALVAENKELTLLPWQAFLTRVDGYAHSVMLRNDYPDTRVVDGIVCLVGSKQGTGAPWGLTWNGGIALTFNDYQYARRSYAAYKANPAAYEPVSDPRKDPVNPGGHLPFAGCQ